MLTPKQIEKVKIKIVKDNITQSKLSRKCLCSNSSMSNILNRVKEHPNIEKRLLIWLSNKETK